LCEEERGGYLPVLDVLKAICDEKEGLGYKGWISMELFNRSLLVEGSEVPTEHAERAMRSWGKIVKAMGWEKMVPPFPSRKTVIPRGVDLEQVEISARL
jgi:4-hydroxyphenylpyruvate dioxygenase